LKSNGGGNSLHARRKKLQKTPNNVKWATSQACGITERPFGAGEKVPVFVPIIATPRGNQRDPQATKRTKTFHLLK